MVVVERSMRDLVFVHGFHGLPGAAEVIVGEAAALSEGCAIDVFVGQDARVGAHLGCKEQARLGNAGGFPRVGHQRCVLDCATHVERRVTGLFSQAQRRPDGAKETGAFEVPVENGHVERLAGPSRREVPATPCG